MHPYSTNPYIVGNPVTGDEFFGREDVLQQALNTFRTPGLSAVVIYGQRRIGKTSILLELKRRLTDEGTPIVYLDLMDMAGKPFGQLLKRLAREIAKELNLPSELATQEFDDEGTSFQHNFLPQAYQAIKKDQRIVLLFDEFDVLDILQREKLPDAIAANRFFPTLREWMREESKLVFGFALGREINDLDTDFLATFKGGLTIRVSVLEREATKHLILKPIKNSSRIKYADSAVDRIYNLAHGHPYFTQLLCKLSFDKAFVSPLTSTDNYFITTKDVDELIPLAFNVADNVFSWIWNGLPPAERILTSALAELLRDDNAPATRDDLLQSLQTHRLRIIASELQNAPDRLAAWQLLEKIGNGYRFLVPIFRQWVQTRKPLSESQTELDRMNPRAQYYYEAGKQAFEDGDFDSAIQNLNSSLRANPEHLQARLTLGQIYLEQNKLDDAIATHEEAYKRDDVLAKYRLIQSLMLRAEKSQNPTSALVDYQRILAIEPNYIEAKECREKLLQSVKESPKD